MANDYLWDGVGAPDAETQRLEKLLGKFRYNQAPPKWPIDVPLRSGRPEKLFGMRWLVPVFAVAAAVILLTVWIRWHSAIFGPGEWGVQSLAGNPQIGGSIIQRGARLHQGEWLQTDANSKALLRVDGLGKIEVEPNTLLQLQQAEKHAQHISLQRGAIHASITAPPYVFLVRTPSAYALDMGCAYTLEVSPDGSGVLRVTVGWVEFQHHWIQSLVPAGAAAETEPGLGPGAPYFEDASPAFRAALHIANFYLSDDAARSTALTTVLAEARPHDALTLLNLFRRVPADDRGRLFDRLAQLLPPPASVNREAAVDGDFHTLDPWWPELHLGSAKKGNKPIPQIEE